MREYLYKSITSGNDKTLNMAKNTQAALHDFQISFYNNTTRIGLDKAKFVPQVLKFVQHAIDNLIEKSEIAAKNEYVGEIRTYVPYSVFPLIKKSLEWFNKKHQGNQILVYYKHNLFGVIVEDIPQSFLVCPTCQYSFDDYFKMYFEGTIMLERREVVFEYNKKYKLIRKVFKDAFEAENKIEYVCSRHGSVKPKNVVL